DSRMGGRLLAEVEEIDGLPGPDWVETVLEKLGGMDNVTLMPRTTVTGAYDQGTFGALERVAHHLKAPSDLPRECFWRFAAKRTILCAGALERAIAFRDNDRPGVMTAGAVRAYLNRWGVVGGKRVAVFGSGDDAHRTARDLTAAGVEVTALIDARDDATTDLDLPFHAGAQVARAHGRLGLTGVTLQRPGRADCRVEADILAVSGGWNPSVHLTCHMNGRPVWRDDIAAFIPSDGAVPGLESAGAAAGFFSTHGALESGQAAAKVALADLGFKAPDLALPQAEDVPYRMSPLWTVPGKGRAWLDFQNDVTVKDVVQAAKENFRSVEHMKRYTTQGMATDQGKNSNVAALAILADATGRTIPETGTTTFRPPFTPVAIVAMAAGAQGQGFQPERKTTSHAKSVAMGAPMIEAGLWFRPSYFPRAGEKTWRAACDREVRMVRETVGICDVSTLGKIDIQGPDAAAFLDLIY
ncbi:MAG: sarcosine oxidase subunit alpha, partial [Rhodobacteraceae bacterium]|nr:sarcosine oxidase subunit alpha [Paracoccaceae bacterium]